ncbi:MAG: hypothetical protein KBT15_05575 [Bacteroidales bacterium]|nr:hypothetical protein [Candidatus Minthousia equi]
MGKQVINRDTLLMEIMNSESGQVNLVVPLEFYLLLSHKDVIALGEYFEDENPEYIDPSYSFGIKKMLDMALVERVVEEDVEELEKEYSVEITEESIKESYDTVYVNMGRTLSILMK